MFIDRPSEIPYDKGKTLDIIGCSCGVLMPGLEEKPLRI
jgi:hypothetical protein